MTETTQLVKVFSAFQAYTHDSRDHAVNVLLSDFVRKEYALALKLQKNIVPVAHEEFDWPDSSRLPAELSSIMGLNAVKYNGEFREASVQKIISRLVL